MEKKNDFFIGGENWLKEDINEVNRKKYFDKIK